MVTARIKPKTKKQFKIETVCINQLADSVFDLTINRRFQEKLRAMGRFLPDVRFILAHGQVVRSDMFDDLGLWEVYGLTFCGQPLTITVLVDSAESYVEPIDIK